STDRDHGSAMDTTKVSICRPGHLAAVLAIALCATLLPYTGAARAQAPAAAPPVRYDAGLGTIFVGDNYTDPNLAGYPSQPGAPKSPITIPQIAAALANPALLQDQGGGVWLLHVNLVINATARLDATSASIGWLRLDSTPNRTPAYVNITANGGYLNIQ